MDIISALQLEDSYEYRSQQPSTCSSMYPDGGAVPRYQQPEEKKLCDCPLSRENEPVNDSISSDPVINSQLSNAEFSTNIELCNPTIIKTTKPWYRKMSFRKKRKSSLATVGMNCATNDCGYASVGTNKFVLHNIIKCGHIGISAAIRQSMKHEEEDEAPRDLLKDDCHVTQVVNYQGDNTTEDTIFGFSISWNTPFVFDTQAPLLFRYFRELFKLRDSIYLKSFEDPIRPLGNSGASGCFLFKTNDDKFIVKTAQKHEIEYLKNMLLQYYITLSHHHNTRLPRFYGLHAYKANGKSSRLIVMNNILPTWIDIHERYDLKGSSVGRAAKEGHSTLKDLNFKERHPYGLALRAEDYVSLQETLKRDCRVLESLHIMDYSLLMGVHYLYRSGSCLHDLGCFCRHRRAGGLLAYTKEGERLFLYLGVIDILQTYNWKKRLEWAGKRCVHSQPDGFSVQPPKVYSERFMNFLFQEVFRCYEPENESGNGEKAYPTYTFCSCHKSGRVDT